MLDGIVVSNNPVNRIDPWGLATVENQTGGQLIGGSNDSGRHGQVIIPDGQDSGNMDIDSLDFDGDGIASRPNGWWDYFGPPIGNGEKIPGQKPNCPRIIVTKDQCGNLETDYDWSGCF